MRILFVVGSLILLGCVHTIDLSQGNPMVTAAWVKSNVVKNKTTKSDLINQLGKPNSEHITADYTPKVTGLELSPAAKSRESSLWLTRTKYYTSVNPNGYRTTFFTAIYDENNIVVDYNLVENTN